MVFACSGKCFWPPSMRCIEGFLMAAGHHSRSCGFSAACPRRMRVWHRCTPSRGSAAERTNNPGSMECTFVHVSARTSGRGGKQQRCRYLGALRERRDSIRYPGSTGCTSCTQLARLAGRAAPPHRRRRALIERFGPVTPVHGRARCARLCPFNGHVAQSSCDSAGRAPLEARCRYARHHSPPSRRGKRP